eukprot:2948423-Prymnesium_polylepis.1
MGRGEQRRRLPDGPRVARATRPGERRAQDAGPVSTADLPTARRLVPEPAVLEPAAQMVLGCFLHDPSRLANPASQLGSLGRGVPWTPTWLTPHAAAMRL